MYLQLSIYSFDLDKPNISELFYQFLFLFFQACFPFKLPAVHFNQQFKSFNITNVPCLCNTAFFTENLKRGGFFPNRFLKLFKLSKK
jgi:hypothetical protein